METIIRPLRAFEIFGVEYQQGVLKAARILFEELVANLISFEFHLSEIEGKTITRLLVSGRIPECSTAF